MFTVIGIMFAGVLVGYLFRRQEVMSHVGKVVTGLIWLLLFLLGVEVGSDERIVKGIHTLGVEAFILCVGGLLGSLFFAAALWRYVVSQQKKGEGR